MIFYRRILNEAASTFHSA